MGTPNCRLPIVDFRLREIKPVRSIENLLPADYVGNSNIEALKKSKSAIDNRKSAIIFC
jgi:hypothetical protein